MPDPWPAGEPILLRRGQRAGVSPPCGAMLFLVVMLSLMVLTPAYVIILSVTRWVRPAQLVFPVDTPWGLLGPLPEDVRAFIAAHGLEQTHALQYRQVRFGVYPMNAGVKPLRTFYVLAAGGKFFGELCTEFATDQAVTTSRSLAGLFLPLAPGRFMQAFPKATLDELWQRHLEAGTWLLAQGRVTVGEVDPDIVARSERGIRRQMAFTRAQPLFWLRAVYWFWVKRFLLGNKTVRQQLEPRGAPMT